MKNRWYTFYRFTIGTALYLYNRPWMEGRHNVPKEGAALMVSNHQSVMDSFYLPLMVIRQLRFPAKSEYFTTPGLVGRIQKFFFSSVNQIPIYRKDTNAADATLKAAKKVFAEGDILGIYPEGTRSPDGRIYKGRTGMARIALETGVPVIPVAMINTRKANPIGSWIPRPVRVGVKVGEPIDPRAWARDNGYDPDDTHSSARPFTDFMMKQLSNLTEQPYVDVYASDVKKALADSEGYPAGAQPGGEKETHPPHDL